LLELSPSSISGNQDLRLEASCSNTVADAAALYVLHRELAASNNVAVDSRVLVDNNHVGC